jgi:hypothetical protein
MHAKVGDALVRVWIGHGGECGSVHLGDDISGVFLGAQRPSQVLI